jgi:hypothetical protein
MQEMSVDLERLDTSLAAQLGKSIELNSKLRARNAQLDAALRKISDFPYIGEKAAQQMALIARAARAPEQDK